MQTLNEEIVDKLSKDYLDKFMEKTKENFLDEFYNTASTYLYEHFTNLSDKVYNELCMSIITGSKEFYGKVYQKRDDLIKVIYEDNKDDILNKITIERLSGVCSNILKNKQYHWSKEGEIQKCIIHIIKNNLCEFEKIVELVSNELVLENERITKENTRLLENYNTLKAKLEQLSDGYCD